MICFRVTSNASVDISMVSWNSLDSPRPVENTRYLFNAEFNNEVSMLQVGPVYTPKNSNIIWLLQVHCISKNRAKNSLTPSWRHMFYKKLFTENQITRRLCNWHILLVWTFHLCGIIRDPTYNITTYYIELFHVHFNLFWNDFIHRCHKILKSKTSNIKSP